MVLLIVSDSPALKSGLGRVTRELARRFVEDGVEVVVAGWFHTVAPLMEEEPCLIVPASKTDASTVDHWIDQFTPDVVLAIGDPWDFVRLSERRADRGGFRLVGYLNVEGEPVDPSVEGVLDGFDVILTTSEYGARTLGRSDVGFVHHGVDTEVFAPRPPKVKTAFGKVLAETFIVFANAQNVQRKNLVASIAGFAEFSRGKSDVLLYLNTQMVPLPHQMEGQNLTEYVAELGLTNVAATTNPGPISTVEDAAVAEMYAIATVLLVTSMGEGFGLPVLEAMASGTVPVATQGFSMLELLAEERGFFIPPSVTFRGYRGADYLMVHPSAVAAALERAYQEWKTGELTHRVALGVAYARARSWDVTYDVVAEAVHRPLRERVANGKPIDPATRAMVRRRFPTGGEERVGVLKMGTLGDMLQLSAVVQAARLKYQAPLVVFTNSGRWGDEIFSAMDGVQHVRIASMKQDDALRSLIPPFPVFLDVRYVSRRYGDAAVPYADRHRWFYDVWPDSSSRIATLECHTTEIMLRSLGLEGAIRPVYATRHGPSTDPGTIALCSGAGHPLKQWPHWAELAQALGADYSLIQIGGPTDPEILGARDMRGLSLARTARALEGAAGLVTTEGAMHHLAAAVGCRTYVIVGPTPEVSFIYPGQRALTVERCHPCFWSMPMWGRGSCALGEPTCIRMPTWQEVLDLVQEEITVDRAACEIGGSGR